MPYAAQIWSSRCWVMGFMLGWLLGSPDPQIRMQASWSVLLCQLIWTDDRRLRFHRVGGTVRRGPLTWSHLVIVCSRSSLVEEMHLRSATCVDAKGRCIPGRS
ncbi:hypothetical protein U1Q18_034586 [Sarracenia purpurea var. burkii]